MDTNAIYTLHPKPSTQQYETSNNRKLTKGRLYTCRKIQSVPIYEKVIGGGIGAKKLLGYRYITR